MCDSKPQTHKLIEDWNMPAWKQPPMPPRDEDEGTVYILSDN